MTKIQKIYSDKYTVVSNGVIKDDRLSWKARGIFMYLWSMPDDWDFYEAEVEKHAPDGRDSLRTGLKELESMRYLVRNRLRNEKGQVAKAVWKLSDKPMSDFTTQDNPTQDNHTLQSTKELSTNLTNDDDDESTEFPAELIQKLYGMFPSGFLQSNLSNWLQKWDRKMICLAIQKSHDEYVEFKKLGKYVEAILNNWEKAQIYTVEQVKESDERFKNSKNNGFRKPQQVKPVRPKNNSVSF